MTNSLRDQVIEVLNEIYDPEIPVNIWELGLIYEVNIDEEANVRVLMTLTSPMCPVAESLPPEVEERVAGVESVKTAAVEVQELRKVFGVRRHTEGLGAAVRELFSVPGSQAVAVDRDVMARRKPEL